MSNYEQTYVQSQDNIYSHACIHRLAFTTYIHQCTARLYMRRDPVESALINGKDKTSQIVHSRTLEYSLTSHNWTQRLDILGREVRVHVPVLHRIAAQPHLEPQAALHQVAQQREIPPDVEAAHRVRHMLEQGCRTLNRPSSAHQHRQLPDIEQQNMACQLILQPRAAQCIQYAFHHHQNRPHPCLLPAPEIARNSADEGNVLGSNVGLHAMQPEQRLP
ncbi:hypothetical protein PG987_006430 [Apiospora arundinis]